MTWPLLPNTQAILLLTAPLLAGGEGDVAERLNLRGYRKLEEHLRGRGRDLADLLLDDPEEVLGESPPCDIGRIKDLLRRGGRLAAAVDHWSTRAIWVLSRFDEYYPHRFRTRLAGSAPPLLYGCGDRSLLNRGGLAVVGPRQADEDALRFAQWTGGLTARAGFPLISGGARGVDRGAMTGALEADGQAVGVLAGKLEKEIMTRDRRDWILGEQMLMVSPYDPGAGFHRGTAMGRNRLIYNLADAALAVEADPERGGTRAGAMNQLQANRKQPDRQVPIYVRDIPSPGLESLRENGAQTWPDPETADELKTILNSATVLNHPDHSQPLPPVIPSDELFPETNQANEENHEQQPLPLGAGA